MSYGIGLWSCYPIDRATHALIELGFRAANDGSYYLPGRDWQIALHQSRTEPEDIPGAIMAHQPGICFLTCATLEPIGAPAAAHKQLRRAVKTIVAATKGIAEDKQLLTYAVPPGHARFIPPKRRTRERFDILQLSWWWNHDRLQNATAIEALLESLRHHVPEAMPCRFGLYEPPQFKTADTGISVLAEILATHDAVVCYTKKPVCGLSFGFHKAGMARGFGKLLCRTSHMTMEFDATALDLPDWNAQIRVTWAALCKSMDPIFGDARMPRNFVAHGATYAADGKSEEHPISAGWWDGVPDLNCIAMVLGGKLADAWPAHSALARRAGAKILIEPERWTRESRLSSTFAEVPTSIKSVDIR